jgi:hypothetical protein
MRGRVISLLSLDRAMVTLGASGAGFLTAALGVQLAQVTYGLVCVVGGLVVVLTLRELRASRMEGSFGFSSGRHGREASAAATPAGASMAATAGRGASEREPART